MFAAVRCAEVASRRLVIPSEARDLLFGPRDHLDAGVMSRTYYVYILASRSRKLYVGVTRFLLRRIRQHRAGECAHTARFRITRLVHVETTPDVRMALAREKELKGWSRAKKVALIESRNRAWDDLPLT